MLLLTEAFKQLDLEKINGVYGQYVLADSYDFYVDFFGEKDAFCAVWVVDGKYCSALRIQKYLDGVLLTGLETAPDERQKGYGYSLVQEVICVLKKRGYDKLYSHVDKKNLPSQRLHRKCGFFVLRDSARLLDGTVTWKMDTLCRDI
jgi:GNAT superfamily N-acetyltransferase